MVIEPVEAFSFCCLYYLYYYWFFIIPVLFLTKLVTKTFVKKSLCSFSSLPLFFQYIKLRRKNRVANINFNVNWRNEWIYLVAAHHHRDSQQERLQQLPGTCRGYQRTHNTKKHQVIIDRGFDRAIETSSCVFSSWWCHLLGGRLGNIANSIL